MARIKKVLSGEEPVWKYAVDVVGHAGLGAAWSVLPIAALVLGFDAGFGVAMAVGEPCALTGGAVREWLQWRKTGYNPEKLHPEDRALDILHHALGPLAAWVIVLLIRLAL